MIKKVIKIFYYLVIFNDSECQIFPLRKPLPYDPKKARAEIIESVNITPFLNL